MSTDRDRALFLLNLRRVARRYGWMFYAYCLMRNHYHLVLQIGEKGISRGMCELNTGYAKTYNARRGRINHLFGKRFWSELITTDERLLTTSRYVVQNPIRAGICEACEDWPWSSYRATIGTEHAPSFLAVSAVLQMFADDPARAVAHYRRFVAAGIGRPYTEPRP